jgi:hypothetical protein
MYHSWYLPHLVVCGFNLAFDLSLGGIMLNFICHLDWPRATHLTGKTLFLDTSVKVVREEISTWVNRLNKDLHSLTWVGITKSIWASIRKERQRKGYLTLALLKPRNPFSALRHQSS